jgi:GNAT superfamily N-acetyltransferase
MMLRPLADTDVAEYSDMLFTSFNAWYWKRGWGKNYFGCQPHETAIFYDIYNDLSPECSVAAFAKDSGRLMRACFYHPREHHVSLGIMSVHPEHFGQGVGRALVNHILDYTRQHDYKSCRLVGSAINMDSFSLYNRSGFIPRVTYHDMVIMVPQAGVGGTVKGADRVREATLADITAMGDLEFEISGIRREIDYRYAIENPRGVLHAAVIANDQGGIDGFMISVKHAALNMLGPCVARTEEVAIALIHNELERFRGTWALLVVPMEKRRIVEQMYGWGAVNVETHLKQVWGEFQDFRGVNMPSFLPETG